MHVCWGNEMPPGRAYVYVHEPECYPLQEFVKIVSS